MARLHRVGAAEPGLTRRRCGRGFRYLDERRDQIRDPSVLDRIRSLAIPPAWSDVWICCDPDGHLQAVGTDSAGRRQYLYHPLWRARRDRAKFEEMLAFGRALPPARRRINRLLGGSELTPDRVLAFAVALLDRGAFRIGGEEYASQNGSYGLSTLERRHVRLSAGGVLAFDFQGKGGLHRELELKDGALWSVAAELLRVRRRATGFLAYRNGRGWHDVRSGEVNAFLKSLVGEQFSAKDFRTWHATVIAAASVAAAEPAHTASERRRVIAAALQEVAAALGNTPAVSRASYVDPRVFDRLQAGQTIDASLAAPAVPGPRRRERVERAVLELLSDDAATARP